MENLDLSDNGIAFLSATCFSDLINLKILNLNHNQLKEVSWPFYNALKKLEELSLRNNSISSIIASETSRNLTSLRIVDFSFNFIAVIEKFTFYDHYKLVELDLKHNLIQKFQKGAFDNLKNLTYLNVDRQMNGSIRQESFKQSNSCGLSKSQLDQVDEE